MKPPTAPPARPHLDRVLGPWMGTALVIGTVIGSGVFKKPQAVATDVPEFGLGMLAWVLVGVLTLIGSLALAEVAILYPRVGGNYVFLREAYGRWAGFLWGWVDFCIIRSGSIAALATIFTESLNNVISLLSPDGSSLSEWGQLAVTVGVIIGLALVNVRGTRWGGGLQLVITTVKVGSLIAIAILPLVALAFAAPEAMPSAERLEPIWPTPESKTTWSLFGGALVGVLWAYHGWMNITPVAEEVRDPSRNIPLSLIAGTLAVIALYLSVNLAYYLVVDRIEIIGDKNSPPVAAIFFRHLFPSIGLMIGSAAIMTSVFGSLNGNLLVGPRLLYAMGNDGLAPPALGALHPRYHTPAVATFVLTGWTVLLVVGVAVLVQFHEIASPFDLLTNYVIFGSTSFETLGVASLFVFRRRFPPDKVQLPYRCRFYPWLPLVYVAVMAAVLLNMFATKPVESVAAVGFIAVGALVYGLFLLKPGRG